MNKKSKISLISIGGIISVFLIVFIIGFGYLLNIRNEFVKYLKAEYPEQSFKVGFTNMDVLYDKYYAKATCLTDGTQFGVLKDFNTEVIRTNYIELKSSADYNAKIRSIFSGSDIEKSIEDISGSGKIPYDNSGRYESVYVFLIGDTNQAKDAKKILNILKDNNITAEKVDFIYEKGKSVYEISLPTDDYDLTEEEIESKVRTIKEP